MARKTLLLMSMTFFSFLFAALSVTVAAQHEGKIEGQSSHGSTDSMKMDGCQGFVILSNGHAVLSGISPQREMASGHHGHHASEESTMNVSGKADEQGHSMGMKMMEKDPLMGHKHGEHIKPEPGMICVSLNEKAETQWTAVSSDDSLHVTVNSLRGRLAHNSRDNEGFQILVTSNEKTQIGDADVRVIARMPQHDRGMPSGHGPANDPDVQGMTTTAAGGGRYTLNNIDFNMGGAWLFEVEINRNGKASKAYFAARVGQE